MLVTGVCLQQRYPRSLVVLVWTEAEPHVAGWKQQTNLKGLKVQIQAQLQSINMQRTKTLETRGGAGIVVRKMLEGRERGLRPQCSFQVRAVKSLVDYLSTMKELGDAGFYGYYGYD